MSDLSEPLDLADQLSAYSRVTGLELCFHDYQMKSGLVLDSRIHSGDRCMKHKEPIAQGGPSACFSFCGAGGKVDEQTQHRPKGWVHQCPFGLTQISVPLFSDGQLVGVLRGVMKKEFRRPSKDWIEDRRTLLLTLAAHLAVVLQTQNRIPEDVRRQKIQSFFQSYQEDPVELADLAKHLHLSPSRARHVTKELFGQTFTQLLGQTRLDQAATWLTRREDMAIGDIAHRLCFYDQSHFTRVFAKRFGMPPLAYRKKTRAAY